MTGASCGQLTAVLDNGSFPRLEMLLLRFNFNMTDWDEMTVYATLNRAKLKRGKSILKLKRGFDRPGSPGL